LGRTGLTATPLGFGGAPIGGLYRPVADDDAIAVVRRAWDLGIRLFDTAPLYGYGASERRVGAALADRPRDAFVLSTKVGRLVAEVGRIPPDAEIDRQVLDGREDGAYAGTAGRKVLFDFSADGVRRSIDESLERLGLDRIDIALIHDPDDHWVAAIRGAYPPLAHPAVAAVLAGVRSTAHLEEYPRLFRAAIPADLWSELRAEGLIPPEAPTPP